MCRNEVPVSEPISVGEFLAAQRPRRADAARNFDALLTAAREAFAEHGAEASLEDIARRAGVGIGTLYRNFPTRRHLFEAVYANEVDDLGRVAAALADRPSWDALTAWLSRFVDYAMTKRAIREALQGEETAVFLACRRSMYDAGTPLLERAQQDGAVRADMDMDDLLRMVSGIASVAFPDEEQRAKVLAIALDGIRPRP
ncbi:TetR family transcriptional regulator [Kitasatospora griseola]|uniref:TetR family transcriptional regulator n=1 Tax=Kitasatospora griseola TaxID=2064 RepID=A0A0D0P1D9_KITGR|nr:TetR/AcrR family transcriptional regulator [Kitasatospora griseola]KIQ65416.1 TetR family transcriptional regulator [Kitasatospora griseola]